ncbi:uncharacterized protein [Rutidosis leptorrhynchoides]|uniref:uncharacterized protein n=1 Tax=Rutidosis leptorrhynchoides TaxID=125765 RepID=UPI003A995050
MKAISINIRGFKKDGKVGWFNKICITENPSIVVVQETKCRVLSDAWIERLWGNSDYGYVQKAAAGRLGGILTIWDSHAFDVNEVVEGKFFLAIKGKFKGADNDTIMVNVYGPHDDERKKEFWDSLEKLMRFQNPDWILCGDFNEVRHVNKRQNSIFMNHRAGMFNDFIDKMCLIEIPLAGKKFTRICDNGRKFSKLDRFLVSTDFVNRWGNLSSVALERKLSNHYPIMLSVKNLDYGPKPVRIFDVRYERDGAEDIVKKAWAKQCDSNRPDICFRKKLKQVKDDLRSWNKSMFGSIDEDIELLKVEAEQWELLAENRSLGEDERSRWMDCRDSWIKKDKEKKDMLRQKARINWATEGDENSKFFHVQIKRRNNKNNIRGLYIDGKWEDDPVTVKNAILHHFRSAFCEQNSSRPQLTCGDHAVLSNEDVVILERPFDEK